MAVRNIRTQYAVGQRIFQAAELFDDRNLRLRYVVDCGAMTKYAVQRDTRIDAYLMGLWGSVRNTHSTFSSHMLMSII